MIAGVRQFKLINGNGTEYDMTRPDALLHAPDGLGWGTEATVNRLGMTYIGINEKEIHQSPSGEMVFRTYEEYGRFLSFCQQGGLVLCYKPLETWYYCECLISIQKSEIQWENNHLICPVQFTLLSYWYEKVVAQTAEPPEPVEPNYRTVTGDPAVFNARYSYPIKDLSVAIQGTQDLNGYDKPWVGGAGSNIYPYETIPAYTYAWYSGSKALADARCPILLKANTGYVLSATREESYAKWFFIFRVWDINGTIISDENVLNAYMGRQTTFGYEFNTTPQYFQSRTDTEYNYCRITPTQDIWIDLAVQASKGIGTSPQLEKGTSPTEYTPYENICPITSYTSVTLTQTGSQTNTYEVELTGAGNVYKGTLDVTSGELVVERVVHKLASGEGAVYSNANGFRINTANFTEGTMIAKTDSDGICNILPRITDSSVMGVRFGLSQNSQIYLTQVADIIGTTASDFNSYVTINDVYVCYELATPQTYQLTPTQLSNLIGQNTIKADAGAVTVTYRTDARTEYKVYPYQYSYKYGDTAQNVFDIDCDLPSYFKLTIFGEATNPSWRVVQNGSIVKSGKLNATIGSSQKLVINTDPKNTEIALYTISNTRINNLYGYSDFATERIFALPQGECQVQVLTEDEQPPKVMIEVLKHV